MYKKQLKNFNIKKLHVEFIEMSFKRFKISLVSLKKLLNLKENYYMLEIRITGVTKIINLSLIQIIINFSFSYNFCRYTGT